MSYTIYVRTNTVNGMQYVGQTCNFRRREHQWRYLKGTYGNKFLSADRLKYGIEAFQTSIIADVETEAEAISIEEEYISKLNTLYPNGSNRTSGGAVHKGKGLIMTDEERYLASITHLGHKHTDEQKEKLRKSLTNHPKKSKRVLQFTLDGKLIKEYPSLNEVKRQTGFNCALISKHCNGMYKQAYGFKWQYA